MSAPAIAPAQQISSRSRQAYVRLVPQIETYPPCISFVQTTLGKAVLLAAFGACLRFLISEWLPMTLCLALMTFMPAKRRPLLAISTLVFTFVVPLGQWRVPLYTATLILSVIVLGMLLFWSVRYWPTSPFARRPLAFLLAGFAALILITSRIPRSEIAYTLLWDFIAVLSTYIWFIGYALLDRTGSPAGSLPLQLGTFRPFWGSSNTPFPKGAAYLRRIEARNPQELAVVQLKGLKLLVWAILIAQFLRLWEWFFYAYLAVPSLQQAMAMNVARMPVPWHRCWLSLLLSFLESIMSLSVFGHRVIACCRLAGFNALRNTYRPLSSVTVAEFFNRYYFYFKELLVDFFFYPSFFRYFKKHPKLRLAAATFAAACLGNAFFHFTRDWSFIQRYGIWGALVNYQVYMFYCVILAAGLCVSQLRRRAVAPVGFIRSRLVPALSVSLFYMLLDVFGSTQRNYPLTEHFRFFGHLFHIDI